jgi:tRNA-dihydrouridine synthase 3
MSTGQNLRQTVSNEKQEQETAPSSSSESNSNEGAAEATSIEGDDKPKPGAILSHQQDVKNVISKDTIMKLRKNQYPFVCKRHFELQKDSKKNKAPRTSSIPVIQSSNKPTLPPKERKLIDFRNKVYIAPLTTVGNLPFRRIMKHFEADITCGEMALSHELLSGKPSEWALLKRHPTEDVFGVQIAGGHADQYTRVAEILANEPEMEIDFVDFNLGCPIDLVCEKGSGAALMLREKKLRRSLEGVTKVLSCPVTVKMRTGWDEKKNIAVRSFIFLENTCIVCTELLTIYLFGQQHLLVPTIQQWGIDGIGAFMVSICWY